MKKKVDYDFLIDSKLNRFLLKLGEKLFEKLDKLYFLSLILFFLSLGLIGVKYFMTGSFYSADYTIKGGIKITFPANETVKNQIMEINNNLEIKKLGNTYYFVLPNNANISNYKNYFEKNNITYNVESTSPLLSSAFFKTLIYLILFSAFLIVMSMLMIYKDVKIASVVGRALIFNLTITFAITNLFLPLNKYIIPAYLMIIGYGIDTNLILINHLLKEKKFEMKKRFALAFNTGIMIHLTTLAVLVIGLILANNEVFKAIFTVLAVGLIVDIIDTWFFNGYLLKKLVEEKEKKI